MATSKVPASRQHRDCVLGVSFLISTISYWPAWRGRLPSVDQCLPLLQKIHHSLEVERIPEGEARDIGRACDAAADFGAAYDSEDTREEQYRGWLRMWFMGASAFEDAYRLSEAWVRPSRDLWAKAAEAIKKASRGLAKAHPQEALDGERIWCAHASPYHHEELEEWISG